MKDSERKEPGVPEQQPDFTRRDALKLAGAGAAAAAGARPPMRTSESHTKRRFPGSALLGVVRQIHFGTAAGS